MAERQEQQKKQRRSKGTRSKLSRDTLATEGTSEKKRSSSAGTISSRGGKAKNTRSAARSSRPLPKSGSSSSFAVNSAVRHSIAALIMIAIGIFLIISIQTDLAGVAGAAIGDCFKGLFGAGAFILAYLTLIYGILMFARATVPFRGRTILLLVILFLMADLINAGRFVRQMKYGLLGLPEVFRQGVALKNGGVFGMYVGRQLYDWLGMAGLYLVAGVVTVICVMLLVNTPMSRLLEQARIQRLRRAEKKAEQERKRTAAVQKRAGAIREDRNGMKPPSRQERQEEDVKSSTKSGSRKQKKAERELVSRQEPQERKRKSFRDMDAEWHRPKPVPVTEVPASVRSDSGRPALEETDNTPTDAFSHLPIGENRKQILRLVDSEYSRKKDRDAGEVRRRAPEIQLPGREAAPQRHNEEEFHGFVADSKVLQQNASDRKKEEPFIGFKSGDRGTLFVKRNRDGGSSRIDPDRISGNKESHENRTAVGPSIGGASVATAASATENSDGAVNVTPQKQRRYHLPPLELLHPAQSSEQSPHLKENLTEQAAMLEQTLASFNVDARVVNVISGPSVTRYEIEPARGVKVQRITGLADDIALNMRAQSIRIEAPIPGKAAVGIEIENETRQMVGFREIVGSPAFRQHKSKLAFTVGRDIGGKPVVADLSKMPHLLIAGATGSGKSVCINTIINSILYKARPEEVKMVLIDPKMVELGNYNGIPHLLIPVVTDASKAAAALNWAVSEMTNRYKKFAAAGVRKIAEYNKMMRDEMNTNEILPQIVIIIDELADLMMVASSQVEDAICRLAQLARAAGMHLVIATQRPSVDVITGLIKANIPSRIAFMVSSQVDSRTIIDMPGAEKLVGNGDMLFKPQDLNKPKRIQGPYIDDEEVERVIQYVKSQSGEAEYSESVIEKIEQGNGTRDRETNEDELMTDAVDVVVAAGQASVSMLQRRFRIGYNRAARLIDGMEERGIVGPQDGSRPRTVLISPEELEKMKEKQ